MIARQWIDLGLAHSPRRVVSLAPAMTESLFDLNLGAVVRAVTDDCLYPAAEVQALPRVGPARRPDVRQVQATVPDLILASADLPPAEALEALSQAGFRLWLTDPRTARQAIDLLWDMVQFFQAPQATPVIDQLERAFEWTLAAAEGIEPVRVFCPLGRDGQAWVTANADTYVSDALLLCGGANVFAGHAERYPRVSLAEAAALKPEVVLLAGAAEAFGPADSTAVFQQADLTAARNGHVYFVDGNLLTWPGTRLARLLSSDLPHILNQARPTGAADGE